MSKFQSLALGAIVVVAAVAAACADGAREPITSPPSNASTAGATGTPSIQSDASEDARAKFHRLNYADWVGRAHNKALDEFFAAMLSDQTTGKDFCARVLEFMSEAARVPSEKNQGTREQRRSYAVRGLTATQACRGQLTDKGSPIVWLVGTVGVGTFAASVDGVSAAANSLLDQIGSAQSAAKTASGLATSLTPILTQADQLVSGERDLVYATASVTQSSFEYWLANMVPQSEQVDMTYGGCLGQYTDQARALSTCMGIVGGGITPTGYRHFGDQGRVTFTASTQTTGCDGYRDMGAIGAYDFGGAVVGGAWGLFGGPGGVLLGAINGGGAASATESWAQFGRWAHCKRTGGSGLRSTLKTT